MRPSSNKVLFLILSRECAHFEKRCVSASSCGSSKSSPMARIQMLVVNISANRRYVQICTSRRLRIILTMCVYYLTFMSGGGGQEGGVTATRLPSCGPQSDSGLKPLDIFKVALGTISRQLAHLQSCLWQQKNDILS